MDSPDTQTRTAEILQAEEAIRLLAGEISRAKDSADTVREARRAFDQVRKQLDEAVKLLRQSGESTQKAADAQVNLAESSRQDSTAALTSFKGELATAAEQMSQSAAAVREAQEGLQKLSDQTTLDLTAFAEGFAQRYDRLYASLQMLAQSLQVVRQENHETPERVVRTLRKQVRQNLLWLFASVAGASLIAALIGMALWATLGDWVKGMWQ